MAFFNQKISLIVDGLVPDISSKELLNIKKRVEFYADHYKTIKKTRNDNITYESKINFLSNLNNMLKTEINKRQVA